MKLTPNPIPTVDPETGKLLARYLPVSLEAGKVYRVVKEKRNGWGVLVKTDRLNTWVNKMWFREVS